MGGGQGDARHGGKAVVENRQLAVLGPEIVAPLGHAMGLVDGEQGQFAAIQQVEEAVGEQAFGRDIDEVERAGAHGALNGRGLGEGHGGIQRRRAHAELLQRGHLVPH